MDLKNLIFYQVKDKPFNYFSKADPQLSSGGESPSPLQAWEEMRMKTGMNFSVSVMKVISECSALHFMWH